MEYTRISQLEFDELLERVVKPAQYLGNEWGAMRKPFESARVRLALAFPDIYELGMSNFGLKILYKLVNRVPEFMVDRTYAPASDMEDLLRERNIPLWCWESRRSVKEFDLVGFSLQYELTYTNVLNMLELSGIPIDSRDRDAILPLTFGGGPSGVNPEPMARFLDFFMIGDGEEAVPHAMAIVDKFKQILGVDSTGGATFDSLPSEISRALRNRLLLRLSRDVAGIYVPCLYSLKDVTGKPGTGDEAGKPATTPATPIDASALQALIALPANEDLQSACPGLDIEALLNEFPGIRESDGEGIGVSARAFRQVAPLSDDNQPTGGLVSYLSLVHDRETLEVRRGCDRGCRFCQPGYTFLPVRERSSDDILRLSKEGLKNSGHEEYSLLSLCVSDYTSLTDTVRELNREHSTRRTSLSFPSQRADRMNVEVAEELKAVRKSGITLAPEAGTERLRAVINKGLNHQQIISAIESAYISGWSSVKLYFMCCLPTETDEDLKGIIDILLEATLKCRAVRKTDPEKYRRAIEFTCTISNFVPKPHTPFQWYGTVNREETRRKHRVLVAELNKAGLKNVTLNTTDPEISLLESVISRGGREMGDLILRAWQSGAKFDAWDERFKPELWHRLANEMGRSLEEISCTDREVGSPQPWDVVHVGLHNWWLVKEWEKALATSETPNCTENTCHACGVCTELDTHHELANPNPEVVKRNPFVKELAVHVDNGDSHPSLFFQKPPEAPSNDVKTRLRFEFTKLGDLRFISHLDTQTLLIRGVRRSGINMAYSQGFNPSPKLSLASPLPIFFESESEIAELELAEELSADDFVRLVNPMLPPEVQVLRAVKLAEKPAESLAAVLGGAKYRAVLTPYRMSGDGEKFEMQTALASIEERVASILGAEEILIEVVRKPKKGKRRRHGPRTSERNIRPGIARLEVVAADPPTVEMELSAGSQMHVKPSEVLDQIDKDLRWRVVRLEQTSTDGSTLLDYDGQASRDSQERVAEATR